VNSVATCCTTAGMLLQVPTQSGRQDCAEVERRAQAQAPATSATPTLASLIEALLAPALGAVIPAAALAPSGAAAGALAPAANAGSATLSAPAPAPARAAAAAALAPASAVDPAPAPVAVAPAPVPARAALAAALAPGPAIDPAPAAAAVAAAPAPARGSAALAPTGSAAAGAPAPAPASTAAGAPLPAAVTAATATPAAPDPAPLLTVHPRFVICKCSQTCVCAPCRSPEKAQACSVVKASHCVWPHASACVGLNGLVTAHVWACMDAILCAGRHKHTCAHLTRVGVHAQAVQPAIALVPAVPCPPTPPIDFTGQATLDLTEVRSSAARAAACTV